VTPLNINNCQILTYVDRVSLEFEGGRVCKCRIVIREMLEILASTGYR